MFDLWFELPPILRAGLGLLLIAVAGIIFYLTGRVIMIGLGAIGLVFLLASGAGSNKGGYRF